MEFSLFPKYLVIYRMLDDSIRWKIKGELQW